MKTKVTDEEKQDIRQFHKEGDYPKDIARKTGRALSTINRVIRNDKKEQTIGAIALIQNKDAKVLAQGLVKLRSSIFMNSVEVWSEELITLIEKAEKINERMK